MTTLLVTQYCETKQQVVLNKKQQICEQFEIQFFYGDVKLLKNTNESGFTIFF